MMIRLAARAARATFAVAVVAALTACSTLPGGRADAPVQRAVAAMGGADALRGLRTMEASGTARHWDPDSSNVALGEPRLAGESSFTLQRDLTRQAARTDWQRKLVYPGVRDYRFTEIIADGAGYVAGVDSSGRTKQSQDSNPPAHAMSRFRVVTTTRELLRSSPTLLTDMLANAAQIEAAPATSIGGRSLPTVRYRPVGRDFLVMFDPDTALPARIRTFDYDNLRGDSTYDLVLSDWREVGGVKVAFRQVYQFNGIDVVDTRLERVQFNTPVAAERFEIPAAFRSAGAVPAVSIPYQWVLRRQFIGTFLDSDAIAYDPAASTGLRLQEIGPGVLLTQGTSHNSMVVEMADHLIVFDAPISDAYSQWVLGELKKRYPAKPVRTLVLTHHHMDHAYGTRAYLAAGATLVVNTGNAALFRGMAQAPHSGSPDLRGVGKLDPRIVEVADKISFNDGKRTVHAFAFDNPHSAGALFGFVEDARIGFVTDVWSPGRDPVGAQLNGGQRSLVNGVRKAGVMPERFAGGHGGVAPYADIASKAN